MKESQESGVRSKERELPIRRCEKCGRRLFDGYLIGACKCPRCNWLNKFIDKRSEDLYDAGHVTAARARP